MYSCDSNWDPFKAIFNFVVPTESYQVSTEDIPILVFVTGHKSLRCVGRHIVMI